MYIYMCVYVYIHTYIYINSMKLAILPLFHAATINHLLVSWQLNTRLAIYHIVTFPVNNIYKHI